MLKVFILSLILSGQTSHVSFLGMECIPEQGVIKTFLKMSYDDFMFDYRLTINDDQYFNPAEKMDTTVILLNEYLRIKVQIFSGNSALKSKLTSFESDNGEMKFNLLFYFDSKSKTFRVKDTILDGVKLNQQNLLIFKYNDIEESAKLTAGETEHTFIFK